MNRISELHFTFAGVRSDNMGVKLTSFPKRQLSVMNGEKRKLQRRNGFEIEDDGSYVGIKIKQDIFVPNNSDLQNVKKWLRGTGDLEFSDEPGYAYEATLLTVPEFSYKAKHLEGQQATITWDCQPFKHAVNESQIVLTSGNVFNGQGTENTLPLVKVEGSGSATLIVNGRSMLLTLTSGTPLYLDCDIGKAYALVNGIMDFRGRQVQVDNDWFELYPYAASSSGYNNVNWSGSISRVTFTPRWRWC